jgi:hypothetical protein
MIGRAAVAALDLDISASIHGSGPAVSDLI